MVNHRKPPSGGHALSAQSVLDRGLVLLDPSTEMYGLRGVRLHKQMVYQVIYLSEIVSQPDLRLKQYPPLIFLSNRGELWRQTCQKWMCSLPY